MSCDREVRDTQPDARAGKLRLGIQTGERPEHSVGVGHLKAWTEDKGREHHLVVDTFKLLLALTVTAASVQDRGAAGSVVELACTQVVKRALGDVTLAGFLVGGEIAHQHLVGWLCCEPPGVQDRTTS